MTLLCLMGSPVLANDIVIAPEEQPEQCHTDIPQVRVTVNNISEGGLLSVELYNDPDNFLSRKGRVKRTRVPATDSIQTVCFNIKEPATFAVAVYQDMDSNFKMNRRWNMMPKEPFGLSLNPEMKFGFPKFSNSAFDTDENGADISIDLHIP